MGDFHDQHAMWPKLARTPSNGARQSRRRRQSIRSTAEDGIKGNTHMLMMDLNRTYRQAGDDWIGSRGCELGLGAALGDISGLPRLAIIGRAGGTVFSYFRRKIG